MNISVICACKNRYDSLRLSLQSWLHFEQIKEIIIVDWSSDEPIDHLTEVDDRIKVVRVDGEEYFNLAQPLNLAASLATQDYIAKFDCDYILNPYLNFFGQFPVDENSFISGLSKVEAVEYYNEQTGCYDIDFYKMDIGAIRDYVFTYNPLFKFLKGILYVSKENFDKVGGYDESIETYGWEDTNILSRLELLGLEHRTIKFDGSIIHLPHPDRKRFENCKDYLEIEEYYLPILQEQYDSPDEVRGNLDYVIAEKLIQKNKHEHFELKEFFIEKKINWKIENVGVNKFFAKKVKSKLKDLPSVFYVTLDESIDRQKNIGAQFSKYGIIPNPVISKRFSESNDVVTGPYVHTLNDGTKGCAVSHLKSIKEWYNSTNEEYGFFCEDDLSLETVEYWNFTWGDFIERLPDDWECVQLMCIRGEFDNLCLRNRYWDDWSVTAYIIKRSHAKKLIDRHIRKDSYHLECENPDVQPLIETILFTGNVYTVPLFVEDTKFQSTFEGNDGDVKDGQKKNHYYTHNRVLELWQKNTKSIDEIMAKAFTVKAKIPTKKKKVVDCFPYFNEKEILELRINLLKDHVDKFVITDANHTHSGIPKDYTLKKTIKELGLPEDIIEVIEVDLSDAALGPATPYEKVWDKNPARESREKVQRNALAKCLQTNNFDEDTMFIVSDCDEILNPTYIPMLRDLVISHPKNIFKIDLVHLEGSADMRAYHKDTGEPRDWRFSLFLCTKEQASNVGFTEVRADTYNPYPIVWPYENGQMMKGLGWHFSWMGTNENRLTKAKSFCHADQVIDSLSHKNYASNEMKNFMLNYTRTEGQVCPSGMSDFIMKFYPVQDLPQIIFDLPRVKEFLLPFDDTSDDQSEFENLLKAFSEDVENAENNFNLGLWYESKGHNAPALSYYLRCAERSEDKDLAYEAIIRGSFCYSKQGERDGSSRGMLFQAQAFRPDRPEAYFLLSRYAEQRSWWQDCYLNAHLALLYCDFNQPPLRTDVEYPGKYGLLFEKALSGWWWGKVDESKEIFIDLKKNHQMNSQFNILVDNNLKHIGVNLDELNAEIEASKSVKEIPVIGVPIVNGVHWLRRLIDSVDYPVKDLIIFNNNGRGQITEELESICQENHKFIKNIKVCHLPSNIGCSGAWNLIIKSYMLEPYWIIASHDVCFSPGLLREMVEKSEDPEIGMVGYFDLFLLKDWVVQKVGLFDENFYPAYVEDCDYLIRLDKANVKREPINTSYLHGDGGYKEGGSQTSKIEPELHDKLHHSRVLNEVDYIAHKWGESWVVIMGDDWDYQPWEYPFNNPNLPVTYTTYDLDFVRKKHLGF
jgi:GT2 family glycosyltransferase